MSVMSTSLNQRRTVTAKMLDQFALTLLNVRHALSPMPMAPVAHLSHGTEQVTQSGENKSGGRIRRWNRPCVPWRDLFVCVPCWSMGLEGRSFVAPSGGDASAALGDRSGCGASPRSAVALRPPSAAASILPRLDYWVSGPGFQY